MFCTTHCPSCVFHTLHETWEAAVKSAYFVPTYRCAINYTGDPMIHYSKCELAGNAKVCLFFSTISLFWINGNKDIIIIVSIHKVVLQQTMQFVEVAFILFDLLIFKVFCCCCFFFFRIFYSFFSLFSSFSAGAQPANLLIFMISSVTNYIHFILFRCFFV